MSGKCQDCQYFEDQIFCGHPDWHILETGRHKEQSYDLFSTVGKQNFIISGVFQAYVGELSILFHDKFLDSKI